MICFSRKKLYICERINYNFILTSPRERTTKMNAITVEIIEPSPALAIGLKTLIETSDRNYCVAGVFQDFLSFQIGRKTNSNVILINPFLLIFTLISGTKLHFATPTPFLLRFRMDT